MGPGPPMEIGNFERRGQFYILKYRLYRVTLCCQLCKIGLTDLNDLYVMTCFPGGYRNGACNTTEENSSVFSQFKCAN